MPIRTFISLEIPEESINQIIGIRDKTLGNISRIKWEKKDKLHITLKFLGDTDEKLLNKISGVIGGIVTGYKSLALKFEKFGVFKKGSEPKILWVGVNPNRELLSLVDEIENSLTEFGYKKERRGFKPHITLLRFRGYEDAKKILSLTEVILPEIKFTSDKVVFYESKLLSNGSIYKPIKSFNLKN
jgi:RNA 2',3'-cyclic 3'-phosphodiesterase